MTALGVAKAQVHQKLITRSHRQRDADPKSAMSIDPLRMALTMGLECYV
jgi:hypothetical protein